MYLKSILTSSSLIIVLILMVQGCVSKNEERSVVTTKVFIDSHNKLNYIGNITSDANQTAIRLYDNSIIKPPVLVVSSNGGSINLGLQLANWINKRKLNIEVGIVCASSCANYLFPAGKEKIIRKDSVLIWHGSAWQEAYDQYNINNPLGISPTIPELRELESTFYKKIEVDNLLPIFGQSQYTWGDFFSELIGWGAVGFDYSIDDLGKFGINDIILADKEWDWRKYRNEQAYTVKRVSLDSEFKFQIERYK